MTMGCRKSFLITSRQEIVSSDCTREKAREDTRLSHCDVLSTDNNKEEREAAFEHMRTFSDRPIRIITVVTIEDHIGLDISICHTFKKKAAENVDGTNGIRSEKNESKEEKFRETRSGKNEGCSKGSADLDKISSVASFGATSFATISCKLSMSLTATILLLMTAAGSEGAFTSVSVNALFVVGHKARMNCSTDLSRPVYWARTLVGSDLQQWLYYGRNGFNGNNADGRFSIDKDEVTGRYDVIIEDVQPKDAGQYVCVDDSGIGVGASAELVVADPINCRSRIPSDGVMGYNVFGLEQDFIQFSCSLNYTGNLSPTLKWSWPGAVVQKDEHDFTSAKPSVTSTLKLSPIKELNNIKFQCKANIEGATQHTIDSGLLWESETVNVRYTEFVSNEVKVCPGVKWNLLCNPQCSYSFERNDQGCQCLYKYYDMITQQNYEVTSDVVRCEKDNTILPAVLVPVAVVAALLIPTIVVLVCCIKKKRTKRPFNDSVESGQNINGNAFVEPMVREI